MNPDLPKITRRLKIAFFLVTAAVLSAILYFSRSILPVFVISLLFAYLLVPIVHFFERKGIERGVSILLLYLLFLVSFSLFVFLLLPGLIRDVESFTSRFPEYQKKMTVITTRAEKAAERLFPSMKAGALSEKLKGYFGDALGRLPGILISLFSRISSLILIPFIVFFYLKDGNSFKRRLLEFVPNRFFEMALCISYEMEGSVGKYLRGQMLDCIVVGLLSIAGLSLLKIPNALLIGTIAGASNIVPYLGPVIGFVPAALTALLEYQSLMPVLQVALLFFIVQLLDNSLISPLVVGSSVNLHPLLVLFVVMAGGSIGGVLGAILAVPVTSILKVAFEVTMRYLNQYSLMVRARAGTERPTA